MTPTFFVVFGSAVASVGGVVFLYKTLRGEIVPHPMSWFFWGAFPLIAFYIQYAESAGILTWVTFVSGTIPLLVFAASFQNPSGQWRVTQRDYLFGACGTAIFIVWLTTGSGALAVMLAALADFLVTIPTIEKMIAHPETESWVAYGVQALGFGIALGAVTEWTMIGVGFALYLVVMNAGMSLLTLRGVGKRQIS